MRRVCARALAAAVDLKWLGLHGTDIDRFGVSKTCMLPLTKPDRRKIESLRQHPFVKGNEGYLAELDTMDRLGSKLEIESVHSRGLHFLADTYVVRVCVVSNVTVTGEFDSLLHAD